jgi:LAO/AO transport system kinase
MDFTDVKGAERRRLLARILSRIADASIDDVLSFPASPLADDVWRIGVTGPPGAGKSSLIGRLALARLERAPPASTDFGEEHIAVLAIDPSSPLGGGALLGDRIRMGALGDDRRAYVRSVAGRGSTEGLAHNIADLLAVAEAYGFKEILLETVGVGQADCAIRTLVDTLVLVVHPEAGDSVQAMKSGILELADIYVVNKSDLPGAHKTAAELQGVLRAARHNSSWTTPIIPVSHHSPSGIAALNAALESHRTFVNSVRDHSAIHLARRRYQLQSILERRVAEILNQRPDLIAISDRRQQYRALADLL